MRILILFVAVIIYLFMLVFIESELVKIEVRKETLRNKVVELRNDQKELQSNMIDITNLANIETAAKAMGFFFPEQNDILGVVE